MASDATPSDSPPLQVTLQAATRRLAPVYGLARWLFPSSRVREEPFRVLGPILLEVHHEYSRIEGARLGDLFISRQGLRANFPRSVSISWIQSQSPSTGSTQSPSATVRGVPMPVARVHEGSWGQRARVPNLNTACIAIASQSAALRPYLVAPS